MSISAYIFCVIGVTVVSAQIMRVILWLDQPKVRKRKKLVPKEESC